MVVILKSENQEEVWENLVSHAADTLTHTLTFSADTYKKLFDRVSGGEPCVVIDKQLFREDGTQVWAPFQQNIGQNYIVSDILADMRKVEAMFDTDIGIPNNENQNKKERLITDEVNSNNIETITKCELWLEELKKSCEKTNKMFGTTISLNWRHDPMTSEEGDKEDGQIR